MEPIKLTSLAAEQIKKTMEQEGLAGQSLRVGIMGGGCSGLQYNLDFAKEAQEFDWTFDCEGVKIVIDEMSFMHLHGTEIDYMDGLHGSGFKFNNPNITRSCGCGSSFNTCE